MEAGLSRSFFDRAFPFHASIDTAGLIVAAGPSLKDLLTEEPVGHPFAEVLRVDHPGGIESVADLRRIEGSVQVVSLAGVEDLLIRAEFLVDGSSPSGELIHMLGHPWFTELGQLTRHGLDLSDFPAHAGVGDLLIMLQTRQNYVEDMRRLNGRLRSTSEKLELRNQTLVEELENRRKLEAQLAQASKMEAVGRLAGGIAHDFNNILMAIIGHAHLAKDGKTEGKIRQHLEQVVIAADRASELTARLLAFSRQQRLKIADVSVADAIREAESMLAPLLGERLTLRTELHDEEAVVRVDPTGLQQVLVNLALNARDAMPEGGTVILKSSLERSEEAVQLHGGKRPPGEWILLSVIDQGPGISEEHLDHVFEPFFTTKIMSEGTGLGLSTVWWIVRHCDGWVDVISTPGEGCELVVHLAASECQELPEAPPLETEPPTERVLFVEDEAIVRTAMMASFEDAGWDVTCAHSAEHALRLVEGEGLPFGILVTDIVMPGASGRELATRLVTRWPSLKVIFVTGYDPGMSSGSVDEVVVAKPFTIEQLESALSAMAESPDIVPDDSSEDSADET